MTEYPLSVADTNRLIFIAELAASCSHGMLHISLRVHPEDETGHREVSEPVWEIDMVDMRYAAFGAQELAARMALINTLLRGIASRLCSVGLVEFRVEVMKTLLGITRPGHTTNWTTISR